MNTRLVMVIAVVVMWGGVAWGQVQFYPGGGVGLFNPEIGVVASGTLTVVKPVVSQDRKYVTIGMQAQLTHVVRIDKFPVMTFGGGGFVGGVQPAAGLNQPAGVANRNLSAPSRQDNGAAVLNKPGMTRIAPP